MAEKKKVEVKYLGKKASMPILFPIGVKTVGGVRNTMNVSEGGSVKLDEDDAHRLVAIDPINFAMADGGQSKFKKSEVIPGALNPGETRRKKGRREPKVDLPSGVEEYDPDAEEPTRPKGKA